MTTTATSSTAPSTSTPEQPGHPQQTLAALDDKLSKRFIELDPDGYFLIYVDREAQLLCAKHFTNTINEKGLACDPETGKPLSVRGGNIRKSEQLFTGRTAKELCIKIFEDKDNGCPISYLDHAAYLGREFVRAEIALIEGTEYVQD
ncbi:MAG: DUF4346 domain-containing protein [Phormidesmis sp.]